MALFQGLIPGIIKKGEKIIDQCLRYGMNGRRICKHQGRHYMKNTRIVLVFLFISTVLVSVPSGARAASDEAGFMGIDWGTDLSARQDMRRISCEDAFCSYVRDTDDLSMGEAILTSITYRTVSGRFVEVVMDGPVETRQGQSPEFESENFLALKNVCHDRFGKTSFAASFETVRAEQYRWEYTDIRKILRVNDLLERLKEEPAKLPETGTGKILKSKVSVEQSGETTPAPTDVTGGTSGGASSLEEEKARPKGLRKAAKMMRWLFVNDDPAAGDDPSEKPR